MLLLLIYATTIQCLLLSGAMLAKSKRTGSPETYLSLLLAIIALSNLLNTPAPERFLGDGLTSVLLTPVLYLLGPALLFYTRSVFGEPTTLKGILLHALPWALYTAFSAFRLFTPPSLTIDGIDLVFAIGKTSVAPVYGAVSYVFLVKANRRVRDYYSNFSYVNTEWLYLLHTAFLAIFALLIISGCLILAGVSAEPGLLLQKTASLVIGLFLTATSVLSYMKPRIFFCPSEEKYSTSKLSKQRASDLFEKLGRFMRESQPHLNEDLTLKELARLTDIPNYHLSQIINEISRRNFCDFINEYRIEEVKQMLSDTKSGLTVLDIAFRCGFNSKSSFNAAFRKFTGTTPLRFRKTMTGSDLVQ